MHTTFELNMLDLNDECDWMKEILNKNFIDNNKLELKVLKHRNKHPKLITLFDDITFTLNKTEGYVKYPNFIPINYSFIICKLKDKYPIICKFIYGYTNTFTCKETGRIIDEKEITHWQYLDMGTNDND